MKPSYIEQRKNRFEVEKYWYAVRCCCTPRKIFGFLPLHGPIDEEVTLRDRNGVDHTIKVRPMHERARVSHELMNPHVAEVYDKPATREIAIYSEDRAIEFWRLFPDFVEARE